MVSRAIASLDVWLAQAEAVLQEQREQSLSPSSSGEWHRNKTTTIVTLSTFEDGLVDILGSPLLASRSVGTDLPCSWKRESLLASAGLRGRVAESRSRE